jgi:hypothetical protein
MKLAWAYLWFAAALLIDLAWVWGFAYWCHITEIADWMVFPVAATFVVGSGLVGGNTIASAANLEYQ